ncbi:MAG: hypothetical protein Q8L23_06115 [Caulobacter sp.]|nr:hypothetical protein [Caulobacter sp.]
MTTWEQFKATANTMLDLLLAYLFLYAIYVGVSTRDPLAFALVVPTFGVILFFRMKQARQRWGV